MNEFWKDQNEELIASLQEITNRLVSKNATKKDLQEAIDILLARGWNAAGTIDGLLRENKKLQKFYDKLTETFEEAK